MRIIAGKHRGRVLASFRGNAVRPTPDRVKESLFQILSDRLQGARVIDLFAGSGALGLECLSRGAGEVVFNDASAESVALIKKNLALVKERATVLQRDFRALLHEAEGKFDFIFCDPPYREDYLSQILSLVATRGLLKEGGLVVYESEREESGADGFRLADMRVYGRVRVSLWEKK